MLTFPPADELRRRLPRLLGGLVLFGVGIALMVRADLGLGPWDVLHQGLSERADLAIGNVTILVGLAVLLLWLPIRQRLGLGTILNVLLIGLVADATLAVLDAPEPLWTRVAFLVVGVFVFGPGSGLYIGAGLGPGPRDGLMTGLARGGRSVRVVRTGIELTVLAVGAALGGSVGVGTVLFALSVGPNVHWFLDRMTLPDPRLRREIDAAGSLEGY
ncbi:MAG: YczE/YyaS/YitT family protein [Acidimicrobiales bacterium]